MTDLTFELKFRSFVCLEMSWECQTLYNAPRAPRRFLIRCSKCRLWRCRWYERYDNPNYSSIEYYVWRRRSVDWHPLCVTDTYFQSCSSCICMHFCRICMFLSEQANAISIIEVEKASLQPAMYSTGIYFCVVPKRPKRYGKVEEKVHILVLLLQ